MGTHSDPHERLSMSKRFGCLPFIQLLPAVSVRLRHRPLCFEIEFRNRHKGNAGDITNGSLRRCRSDHKVGVSSFPGRAVRRYCSSRQTRSVPSKFPSQISAFPQEGPRSLMFNRRLALNKGERG
jgi:hypothetical protein